MSSLGGIPQRVCPSRLFRASAAHPARLKGGASSSAAFVLTQGGRQQAGWLPSRTGPQNAGAHGQNRPVFSYDTARLEAGLLRPRASGKDCFFGRTRGEGIKRKAACLAGDSHGRSLDAGHSGRNIGHSQRTQFRPSRNRCGCEVASWPVYKKPKASAK